MQHVSRTTKIIIYAVFFASGVTALIYEITWMRIFSLILGSTTLAGTLILATFFSGFAIGAWLFGHFVDKHSFALLTYSIMEIGLGIFGVLSISIFKGIDLLFLILYENLSHYGFFFVIVKFLILWICLLIPTILMGGTLPVMSKYLIRRLNTSGDLVGKLYAFNTFGAVFGTVLTAFFMIKALGISKTIMIAALINIILGLTIIVLRSLKIIIPLNVHQLGEEEIKAKASHTKKKQAFSTISLKIIDSRNLILLAVFVSGFSSLAAEVLWFRMFSMILDSSVQSFGIVLSIFIGGFALGNLIFARVSTRSKQPLVWMGVLLISSATLLAFMIPQLDRLPFLYYKIIRNYSNDWLGTVFIRYGVSIVLLLPLTFLMGGVFPIAIRVFANHIRFVGGSVGTLYSWNTVGGIFGSILAGILFIPMFGTRMGFIIITLIMGTIGYGIFYLATKGKIQALRILPATIFLIAAFITFISGPWKPERMIIWWGGQQKRSDILFYQEGLEGNVAIVRHDNAHCLFVGKKLVAADDLDTQRHLGLLSHIPLLLHPQPEKVLVIGLATGITLNSALRHHVENAECVEINPVMRKVAGYFKDANQNVLRNSKAHFIFTDARHYLATKEDQYDCITTDPIHPADAHSNNLYSFEFYQMTTRALKKNGIMCQWIPAADLEPIEVKRIMRTFSMVFKYVSLWIPNLSDLALIGSNEPVNVDIALIQKRLSDEKISAAVSRYWGRPTVDNFFSLFALGTSSIRKLCAGIPINTDDKPILEYEAPKNLWNPGNLPNLYFDINTHWNNSFDELWKMVRNSNDEEVLSRNEIERIYFEQRDRNLMHVAKTFRMWCLFLEENEKLEEALFQYERLFYLFPKTINPILLDAAISMSVIYEKLGNIELATQYYQEAISMAPTESESRNLAGQSFAGRNLFYRAQREWELVLKKDSSNQVALYHLKWLKSRGLHTNN